MVGALEQTIRRDRVVALVCVAAISALAWWYLISSKASMTSMSMSAAVMVDPRTWGAADWLELFGMWAVMMVGMMLPSVSPVLAHMLQMFRRRGDKLARTSAAAFVGGHLLAWTGFAALAAAVQIGLHRAALLDASLAVRSTTLCGTVLLAVGVYQCLPVKSACLTQCRPPLRFLSMRRRDGTLGALTMGLQYGAFCIGCCGALMALMFVVGVMNLFSAAILTIVVLLEKVAPPYVRVEYLSGVPLILWGTTCLVLA
jgi:predicted metal-binding membrane protein